MPAGGRSYTNASVQPKEWSAANWKVTVSGTEVRISSPSGHLAVPDSDASRLAVHRRWLRWHLRLDGHPLVRLRGLPRSQAAALGRELRQLALAPEILRSVEWHVAVSGLLDRARTEQRWIPAEAVEAMRPSRPDPDLTERVRAAGLELELAAAEQKAVSFLGVDLDRLVAGANEEITQTELASRRELFERIEKTPLSEEQARAVVCFDNRVQLLAAAGSGKTSVMVARAAYAIARGFVPAERILMLAFNQAAARELQERVTARLGAAGIDATGLRASTFHAFGLEVIGRATGRKPRLARGLDQGADVSVVAEIVDQLRDASEAFGYQWDLYRLVFANAPTNLDHDEPDGYDRESKATGYRTFAGEVVKSHGERLIANFLYLNGVDYVYERSYDIDLADATHSEYRPDFYYPAIDVWHEHWGLDRDGRPAESFEGYAQDMAWKREVHRRHGTTLVESTWAEVMYGNGLAELAERLSALGLHLDWNPDRPVHDRYAQPMAHEDLARLIRTFMTHVKSNAWTRTDLEARLGSETAHLAGYRTDLFLELYWPIQAEWERRLRAEGAVDFEDMLVRAAAHLEAGDLEFPYELVLVDEFQDASRARARLVRALLNRPGRFLLAVGDDWQSINRFAGADLSVMTGFEGWFGASQCLALTTTFRCTQAICDVARDFVVKNPDQLDKPMRSAHVDPGTSVRIIRADDTTRALSSYLEELSVAVADGSVPSAHPVRATVDILGRYGRNRDDVPARTPANLTVTYRTVHGAKGLEADYVVVVGLVTGTYGFPSNISDDPVLDLAMPAPERYPYADERRLFYVALTRARHGVTLVSSTRQPSPFVMEILDHPKVRADDDGPPVEACPECRRGMIVTRVGRYGPFLGCSAFPTCTYTRSQVEPASARQRGSRGGRSGPEHME